MCIRDSVYTLISNSPLDYFYSGRGHDDINLTNQIRRDLNTGEGDDNIVITGLVGSGSPTYLNSYGHDGIKSGSGDDTISLSGGSVVNTIHRHHAAIIYGDDGDDTIELLNLKDYGPVYGGSGNDSIDTSNANYVQEIWGESGDDIIIGNPGVDYIWGGNDNDSINGGNGNNILYGDDGDDSIESGSGNDIIYGGEGNDQITTTGGDNELFGDRGDDVIISGGGEDNIQGGEGDDQITAGGGNDVIYGNNDSQPSNSDSEIDTVILSGRAADYSISRVTESIFGDVYYLRDIREESPDGLDLSLIHI